MRALVLALALAASFSPPPAPTRWVTDPQNVLRPETREALDQRLADYQRQSGREVIVWIGKSTGEVPLEDWSAKTFQAWGVGTKKLDDGLAVFVFTDDRAIRIEVGYGLEPELPDAVASRIIREQAIPRMRAGDPDGALTGTVNAILARLGAQPGAPPVPQPIHLSPMQLIFLAIGVLVLLVLVAKNPGLAAFIFWNLMRGGRGGRGGGGGYSPGGGRSGGGGASGHW